MKTVSSPSHHHHHHHHQTWAHVQQRLRRNCLIGPVAFCLLALLGMPYILDDNLVQRLPLVEAVPFFRRAKAAAFRRRRRSTAVQPVAVVPKGGASDATLEDTVAVAVEPSSDTPTTTTTTTSKADTNPKKRKHAKISAASSTTSSTTTSQYNYNFPLVPDPDAFIQNKKAPIPFRYFEAHQKNPDNARKAVLHSLQWRKEQQIDTILNRPQPNYDIAKRILPHYFVGRSAVTNHVVFVQRPGLADLPLAKHNGLQLPDMLQQYAFVFEYCWNILHSNTQTTMEGDQDLMIGIMDLQGLNLGVLRNRELISFVKEFIAMIDAHYPTRAYKTYMVNAPGWFSSIYKIVSPIMRETTKEKIVIHSAGPAQDEALETALGLEMAQELQTALRIPDKKELKNKPKNDLTLLSDNLLETDMEQEIRNFVLGRLQEEGLVMNKIKPMDS